MDSYWAGLTEFLTSAPSGVGVSLAPRGVAAAIPALTPFEEWDRFQIINRVIVHKGLVGEIPNGLLESLFGTAQSSFANEVFVVYEITPTKDDHVRAVEVALAERAGGGSIRVSTEITPGGRKDADPAFVSVPELDQSLPFEQQFSRFFQPRLNKRADGFATLFQALTRHARPLIIETGCLRSPGNWEGDGQSSFRRPGARPAEPVPLDRPIGGKHRHGSPRLQLGRQLHLQRFCRRTPRPEPAHARACRPPLSRLIRR